MRVLALIVCMLAGAVGWADGVKIVSIDLGKINAPHGLYQLEAEDGKTIPVLLDGMPCRKTGQALVPGRAKYMYFDIDDRVAFEVEGQARVLAEVLDKDGVRVGLEYDSWRLDLPLGGAYTHAGEVKLGNSGKWQRLSWEIKDVRFAGRQNGGADLRLYVVGGDLYVRRMEIVMVVEERREKRRPKARVRVGENFICVGKTRLQFYMDGEGQAYGSYKVRYKVSGVEDVAIVQAYAYPREYRLHGNLYDSAFPGELGLQMEYMGAFSRREAADAKKPPPLIKAKRLPPGDWGLKIRVKNIGDTILRAQGYGYVSLMTTIAKEGESPNMRAAVERWQMLEDDFLPGQVREFVCIAEPLRNPGVYNISFDFGISRDEIWSRGQIFATLKLTLEVGEGTAQDEPDVTVGVRELPLIAPLAPDKLEEFLSSYRIHSEDAEGELCVELPPWDVKLAVRLITPYGVGMKIVPIEVNRKGLSIKPAQRRWMGKEGRYILSTWYYPYRTERFTDTIKKRIRQDLDEMKKCGINALWLQFFPIFAYGPYTQYTVEYARQIDMPIIPSFYFWDQRSQLERFTGWKFMPAAPSGLGATYVDALDKKFPEALAMWFDKVYEDYEDAFLRLPDGSVPVCIMEEQGYGIWNTRTGGASEADVAAFRDWLRKKYGSIEEVNRKWGTAYSDFEEITPTLSCQPPFNEWSKALEDWDDFRSLLVNKAIGDAVRIIRERHPEVIVGTLPFSIYGIEGMPGEHYYSIMPFNWLARRTAMVERFVLDKNIFGPDFLAYVYIQDKMPVDVLTRHLVEKGTDMLGYIYFNCFRMVQDEKAPSGYRGFPQIKARDVPVLASLYPRLKAIYENGGVGGIYCWNDHPLFERVTYVQKRELALIRKLLDEE